MKKLLLIGLILAICMLAFPQGVMAEDAIVTASIEPVSKLTASFTETPWVLTRLDADSNHNEDAITLTVDCNTDWAVSAADANQDVNQGFMLSETDSEKLTDPFKLESGSPGSEAMNVLTGEDPLDMISGTRQSLDTYRYDVEQQVEIDDDAAESYKIVITFTLAAT